MAEEVLALFGGGMREEPTQGTLANSSGNTLEKTVIGTLISKATVTREKQVKVMNLSEFLIWVNKTFR